MLREDNAPPTVAILDYGMGNLRSVEKAFDHVGARAVRTRDHGEVRSADGVVLPGVGAMPKAMELVRSLGFDELLHERRTTGVPIIGICMGMQLLFQSTTELGGAQGIGLLAGTVERLEAPGLKVPHIGWSPVSWRRQADLIEGLRDPAPFYHVHSFAPRPANEEDLLGTAEYGSTFASVVSRGNVYGAQFHPESAGLYCLALLRNFAGLGTRTAA
ncbi:MAG: imidazole glycerol phosphate synthase subunit HisH [Thermoleophilaceae bacterium]